VRFRHRLLVVLPELRTACSGLPPTACCLRFAPIVVSGNVLELGFTPVDVVLTQIDETVKRRPLPVPHSRNQSVFPGVPVDVVCTAFQILFIPDRVFPKARLPDSSFPFPRLSGRDRSLGQPRPNPALGELLLDAFQSSRVIFIPDRKGDRKGDILLFRA